MTQDTRKDRRVKIVSLNVRYKSATVDEFIENHAHDVSRGGIYIKTASPFPPGTLLKFEIRLVSDQALIMGVGRVVWKRDTTQGTVDRPAGMGVKFIKIDDPSKSVIDRLVNTRSDAGRAYESEADVTALPPEAAQPAPRVAASRVGKSTMLGVGTLPQPGASPSRSTRPPRAHSSPPRPTANAMFPKTNPEESTEPKQEQTVMRQAAELLEEALREAGGSMEDVGTNPLFAGGPQAVSKGIANDRPAGVATSEPPSSGPEAAKARAMVAGMSPALTEPRQERAQKTSDPPRSHRESPIATGSAAEEARPTSSRPSGRPSIATVPPRSRKKGSGGTVLLLAVVAAAVAGVMFRDKLFGGGATAEPTPTSSAAQAAPPPSIAAPGTASADLAASAIPAPAASEPPAASASPAPGASASASALTPSGSASALVRPPAPVARPTWSRPAAVQPQVVPTTVPKPTASAAITPPAAEPTASAAPVATSAGPATPATKPKPAAKPADDNPY